MSQIYDESSNLFIDSRSALPGRDEFYFYVEKLIRDKEVESIVLISIELDDLEFFLRMFGPVIRDDVIHEASARLVECQEQDFHLYHITQFRFALVLKDVSHRQAINTTRILSDAFKKPFYINGVSFNIPLVIGISQYPNHAENLHDLVRTVAFATHLARKAGKDYSCYDADQDKWERYQFNLLKDIERGLDTNSEIRLAFQPIVNLQDGSCNKFEGLCRWQHGEHGLVPPGDFLPYVEQSPLIVPFTEYTLGLSLEFNKKLKREGYNAAISVNLSSSLLSEKGLVQKLTELFQYHNVQPENVTLELTETGIMENQHSAIFILNRLREIGCKIAIDDFGTGQSSLAYLADLPIDIIKIDQCFIGELSKNRNNAIVIAAAKIAESLNLEVVAEGIETEGQLQMCKDLGIQYGQGFYLCKPVFSEEAISWLTSRTAQVA